MRKHTSCRSVCRGGYAWCHHADTHQTRNPALPADCHTHTHTNSHNAEQAAAHAGMLTMSQLGVAAMRKEWNQDVQDFRSTCQVRRHAGWPHNLQQHWLSAVSLHAHLQRSHCRGRFITRTTAASASDPFHRLLPLLVPPAHQGKATTREWDINRPDAKQLDLPARLGDGDERCGPASLQRFDGEDLSVRPR